RASASPAAAGTPPDIAATDPFRRGRGRPPARLDQRARPRPLPDPLEPVRPLRPRPARPARLWPPSLLRVRGPRRLSRADLPLALVAAGHARLPRAPHRLVRVAQAEPAGAGGDHRSDPGQRADGERRLRASPAARPDRLVELEAGAACAPLPL